MSADLDVASGESATRLALFEGEPIDTRSSLFRGLTTVVHAETSAPIISGDICCRGGHGRPRQSSAEPAPARRPGLHADRQEAFEIGAAFTDNVHADDFCVPQRRAQRPQIALQHTQRGR